MTDCRRLLPLFVHPFTRNAGESDAADALAREAA